MRLLKNKITKALESASEHHHDYEKNILKGKKDKNWAGWYAGFIFGKIRRLRIRLSISELTNLLEKASEKYEGDNWVKKYAEHIVEKIKNQRSLAIALK